MEFKFKRIFIILSLLFILMISSGVAFAADVESMDITDYGSDISDINDITAISIESDNLSSTNPNLNSNDNIISNEANGGTFSNIQDLINKAREGDTITLDGTYIGSGTPITINKALTIKSTTGATLDGKGLSNIFKITVNNVNLENLIFKNGLSTDEGGAIYWKGYNGVITNCVFENNAADCGGAIYIVDSVAGSTNSYLKISDSKFIANNANIGGAIYQNGVNVLNVTNTVFENNIANLTSGAIYAECKAVVEGGVLNYRYVNLVVDYCNFTGNKALKINGGAIATDIYAPVIVTNSRFVSNYANASGGAIFTNERSSTLKINNTEFIENSANYGGAIHSLSEIDIHFSEFIRNTAVYDGGAILEGVNITVVMYSNFTDNQAQRGSAIRSGGQLSITDCKVSDDGKIPPIFFTDDPEVLLENATINILNKSMLIKNGQVVQLTATLSTNGIRVAGGLLTFKFNTKTYDAIASDDGFYNINYTMGSSNVKVTPNFPNLNLKYNSIDLSVYSITVNNNSVYGVDTVFVLNFPSSFSGKIGFKLDNGAWVYKDVSGKYNYTLSNLAVGNHNMAIKFDGNSNYEAFSDNINFVINKQNTVITVNGVSLTADGTVLDAYIRDANGKALSSKTVYLTVNGTQYSNVSDSTGKVVFNFNALNPGNYSLTLKFIGDQFYVNSSLSISIYVEKIATEINVNDVSSKYGETVLDAYIRSNGKGLAGKTLNLTINGTPYSKVSDANGKVSFNLSSLIPGEYIATLSFNEDDTYKGSSASVSVKVGIIETYITVKDVSSIYGNTTLEAFIYDEDDLALSNKNITLTINGTQYSKVSDANGKVSFNLNSLLPNDYIANLKFAGDTTHTGSSNSSSVVVSKILTNIITQDVPFTYGATVLNATIQDYKGNPLADKNITLNVEGRIYSDFSNSKGEVSFDLKGLDSDNYNAVFTFEGTNIYANSSATATIVVKRENTIINVDNVSSNYGETVVTAYIYDTHSKALSGKKLVLSINDDTYDEVTSDNYGKVTFNLKTLGSGNYIANVSFAGDKNYESSLSSLSVVVKSIKSVIKVNNVTAEYGTALVTAYIYDGNNKPLSGKKLVLSINGDTYEVRSDNYGKVSFNLSKLIPNRYIGTISFDGDEGYNKSNASVSVVVDKVKTVIKVNNVSSKYGETVLEAIIQDYKGNVLSKKSIVLSIDGKNYPYESDNEGKVIFNLTSLIPNNYIANLKFAGDEIYDNSANSSNVTVNKLGTNIKVNSSISSDYGETVVIAYIYDEYNNPLNGIELVLNINGKFVYANSNIDGKVLFNINSTLPGYYGANIKFVGDKIYANSSASVNINVEFMTLHIRPYSVTGTYSEAMFGAYVLDDDNNPLEGKDIILNIDGVNHVFKSDSEGKVLFNLSDFEPKTYSITLSFNGDELYNSYESSPVSFTINKMAVIFNVPEKIMGNYGSTIIKFLVSDANGQALVNKTISLTINGQKYTNVTMDEGYVEFNLYNIIEAIYPTVISFDGDNHYLGLNKTITVQTKKDPVNITISGSTSGYYKSTPITITLSKPIVQKLTLTINNGKTTTTAQVTTNENGVATYYIPYAPGTYKISANGESDSYAFTSNTKSIKILKASATITVYKLSTTYNSGAKFKVRVLNSKKQAMVGVKVKLKVYTGSKYKSVTVTTDSNGYAYYTAASTLSIAKHKIIASNGESTKYMTGSSKTNYITVAKGKTTVSAPKVTNKCGLTGYFKVTVTNSIKKTAISGLTLTVKVYSGKKLVKTYSAKTASNGVASINTNGLAAGTYKVVISTTNKYYAVSKTISSAIVMQKQKTVVDAPAVTKICGKSDYFRITVTKADGGKAVSSLPITVKLYNSKGKLVKTFSVKTDSNGVASINTKSLAAGTYKVVIGSTHKNYAVSKTISNAIVMTKYKTVVDAPAITATYNKKAYFKVNVTNADTNSTVGSLPLTVKVYNSKGKLVKTYSAKTASNGVASINVKGLAKGTYKVVISTSNVSYSVSKTITKAIVIK